MTISALLRLCVVLVFVAIDQAFAQPLPVQIETPWTPKVELTHGATTFTRTKNGYEVAIAFKGRQALVVQGRKREFDVLVQQIRLAPRQRAQLELPANGLAVLQHLAGDVRLTLGDGKARQPLESEWIDLPLPAKVLLEAKDDAVLMDLVTISE